MVERCAAVHLIGAASERLERDLAPAWEAGVEHRRQRTLAEAVVGAADAAVAGEVVLLAPACASFDAYRDFEQRGEHFRELVEGAAMSAKAKRAAPSIEYSLLLTATMCLLAFGVVMVFSASSTTQLLGESGDGAYYLKRTLIFVVIGLAVMRLLTIGGVPLLRRTTPLLLGVAFVACLAVIVPGIGVEINGSRAWIAAGPIQIQPSELMKIALILFAANLLATRTEIVAGGVGRLCPVLGLAGAGIGIVGTADLGTALVIAVAVSALLVAAGARLRDLAVLALAAGAVLCLAIMIEPYRVARITSFLDPGGDPGGAGFQLIQAKIALGSGGIFGVGLGESLQKAFYLPEAHTDMIAAVIGEELGHGRDRRAGRALRDARVRRAEDRPGRPRSLRQAARRRAHLDGRGPGIGQPARRLRAGAADRGAAAVRLLRQRQHAGDDGRGRPAAQHRPRRQRRIGRRAVDRRCETARRRRRQADRARRPLGPREQEQIRCQGSS